MPRESRLILGGHNWHVAPRPRAEGARPLAGAVPLSNAWNDHSQRGTVRAHSKLECCAFSRETASKVARPRVPRESRPTLGGHRWHIAQQPHAEGEGPFAGAVPFPSAWTDHNQRATARARRKLA